ncbi:hypothetical protein MNBD_GAMMA01-1295 [hydrothermal vent metagenome]|uniref:Zinc finger CHC2-type domain-containing protein n=1 Tax=hydrothermal vent metagenome TaxID=652676 RepID=A0A3B0W5H1_9ZZZZ
MNKNPERPSKQQIKDKCLVFDIPYLFGIERKIDFIKLLIENIYEESLKTENLFLRSRTGRELLIIDKKSIKEKIKSLKKYIAYLKSDNERGITPDMILSAKKVNLEKIIKINPKGMAECINPDHNDKNPSMDTRNNYVYCYSCGYSGDVIEITMKINSMDFQTAVRYLTNG